MSAIPIKCFTCGKVIADKYRWYQNEVRKQKLAQNPKLIETVLYLTPENKEMTIEGRVLNEIGIRDVCCRRHFLTHVDIE